LLNSAAPKLKISLFACSAGVPTQSFVNVSAGRSPSCDQLINNSFAAYLSYFLMLNKINATIAARLGMVYCFEKNERLRLYVRDPKESIDSYYPAKDNRAKIIYQYNANRQQIVIPAYTATESDSMHWRASVLNIISNAIYESGYDLSRPDQHPLLFALLAKACYLSNPKFYIETCRTMAQLLPDSKVRQQLTALDQFPTL
jgi:hypothetical protein